MPWTEVIALINPANSPISEHPPSPAKEPSPEVRGLNGPPTVALASATATLGMAHPPQLGIGLRPEGAVQPTGIVMGERIRHRSRGFGTVLSVKPTGTTAELLVRFDTGGEAWMVFGLGLLEFER
jgi:hypothetical protein